MGQTFWLLVESRGWIAMMLMPLAARESRTAEMVSFDSESRIAGGRANVEVASMTTARR